MWHPFSLLLGKESVSEESIWIVIVRPADTRAELEREGRTENLSLPAESKYRIGLVILPFVSG